MQNEENPKSIIVPLHGIELLLYHGISSHIDLALVCYLLLLLLTFIAKSNKLKSLEKSHLNSTLPNSYRVEDLMLLYKEGFCLLIHRLSFNSVKNFMFPLLSTLELSKDGDWLQSFKWLLMAQPFALTFFFDNDEVVFW